MMGLFTPGQIAVEILCCGSNSHIMLAMNIALGSRDNNFLKNCLLTLSPVNSLIKLLKKDIRIHVYQTWELVV